MPIPIGQIPLGIGYQRTLKNCFLNNPIFFPAQNPDKKNVYTLFGEPHFGQIQGSGEDSFKFKADLNQNDTRLRWLGEISHAFDNVNDLNNLND